MDDSQLLDSPSKKTKRVSLSFEDDTPTKGETSRSLNSSLLSVNLSFDASINASTFDPDDSGSDFDDELPGLGKATKSPQRRLPGEDAIEEAEARSYVRPAVSRKKRGAHLTRQYHKSLDASMSSDGLLGNISRSTGLQECPKAVYESKALAESLYRERRPWHSSPVVQQEKEPIKLRRQGLQECPYDPACHLLHDEIHIDRFTHACMHGFFCVDVDPIHRRRFRHPSDNQNDPWFGKSGWKAENFRSPSCAPEIKVATLQTGLPQLSCHPRGGYRPQGGSATVTEMRDFKHDRELKTKDEVVMVVHNIDPLWTSHEFQTFLRDLLGTRAVFSAKVVEGVSEWMNAGKGLVLCYNYSDAHVLKKLVHNRNKPGNSEELLTVEYNSKVDRYTDKITDWRKRHFISEATPTVARFNQMILKCGPYWQDAEGLLHRLRDEGHKPNLYTYIALLHSYREARPPQPRKAEGLIETMRSEGIPIHTTACNAIVDAWCRAGQMTRAEKLVKAMEKSAKAYSIWQGRDRNSALGAPNEQTYLILTDGWQRLGVQEDIAARQRGFKYDEIREVNHRDTSLGGVVGMSAPAPSLLTSLARRRAGYSHMNAGYQSQQANEDFFGKFEPQKWRCPV